MPWTVRGITRTLLPLLLVLTLVEVGSGLVLGTFEETLLQYPSLLVLVPVTIGTVGNLGSILAARLSTVFHLGLLSFSLTDARLAGNALATIAQAITLFPGVGAGAWFITAVSIGPSLPFMTVVTIATASGAVLSLIAVIVALVATYIAYRLGLDPDDVVIPVVTNICDVLGVVVLFLVVAIIL